MSNYNSTLQSNNIDLQSILNTINDLPEAGGSEPVLQDKTVTPTTSKQTVTADSGYDGLDTVTVNAMPTATQATPSISVNSSGLITASATQTAGYVAAGTKSSTYQLAFQAAKTITPTTASQVAVSSGYYTGGNVMVAGDVNLVAGNIKSGVSIFGVSGTLESGDISSGEQEDVFITKAIGSSYFNDRVTTIGGGVFAGCNGLRTVNFPACTTISFISITGNFPYIGAFQYCNNLTTVSFPVCTSIGNNAFYKCNSLTTVSFPVCTSIGGSAFAYCNGLTSVNFPACTSIGNYAFYDCSSLTSVSFPVCTSIGGYAFYNCSKLTLVNFLACITIGNHAFANCSNLTSVSFPACRNIDYSAFSYCSNLISANFPACTSISANAFRSCFSLTTVSFPVCTSIGGSVFRDCYNLKSLYLTGSSLCKLSHSNAFASTPIGGYSASAGTYGYIYVPIELLTSYQTATNWVYFSSRITYISSGVGEDEEEGIQ